MMPGMIKRSRRLVFILALLAFKSISAQPISAAAAVNKWYFFASTGLVPQPQHDNELNNEIIQDKGNLGFSGQYGAILEPGLYHLIGQQSLLGLSSTFIFENYSHSYFDKDSFAISTYSLNISGLSFTGAQPGLGYFIRVDLGPSQLVRTRQTSDVYTRSFFSGVLSQFGLGYGFQFSEGSRLLVDLRGVYEGCSGHYFSAVSFNMGALL